MATAAPDIPVLARDVAFERLYRRYVKDVYHYALALLRNPADAEDVTQTTFLNAYRALKRGEEPLKPHNWLIKIAHNAARTRYARSTRRVKEVPLDEHVESLIIAEDEKPDVQEVLNALGRLPLNQRAALVMRELEGRSYADIADTLGVSVAAVETLIFRARRSLKLKASAIRVLGLVPLPQSLAQLFNVGGAVAGGGAAIGSGFIAKAVVALVVGAVTTGVVGSDRSTRAVAADVPGAIAAPRWNLGVGVLVRPNAFTAKPSPRRHAIPAKKAAAAGPSAASRRNVPVDDRGGIPMATVGGGSSSTPSSSVPPQVERPASSSSPPSSGPVEQVSSTVESSVTQAVPPLPVAAPTLPPPPQLPPVPAVPSVPSVPAVSLPAPPPLPTLPTLPTLP